MLSQLLYLRKGWDTDLSTVQAAHAFLLIPVEGEELCPSTPTAQPWEIAVGEVVLCSSPPRSPAGVYGALAIPIRRRTCAQHALYWCLGACQIGRLGACSLRSRKLHLRNPVSS